MLNVKLISILVCALLLCACGNSIQNAVENIKVTNKDNLIDVLKKSKLIDSYKLEVMDDDPLRCEVAILIKLNKDAVINEMGEPTVMSLISHFFLSQTVSKDVWSLGRIIITGKFSNNNSKNELIQLTPSIFTKLANNEKIVIGKLKNADMYYWK